MLQDRMEKIAASIRLSVVSLALLFALTILAPLVGGIGGWIFAFVFDDSFAALMALLRWDASGFEAGAALAFLGAFLKAGARVSKN